MARTLLDLADSLATRRKAIGQAANEAAKKVALTVISDLAYKTPVDTSQAISNWVLTIGRRAVSTIKPHFPGKHGSSYRASAAETIALAKVQLQSKKPGQVIWIQNLLPYIKRLNDGYSAQQPAGFVERAVLLGRLTIAKFKIKG